MYTVPFGKRCIIGGVLLGALLVLMLATNCQAECPTCTGGGGITWHPDEDILGSGSGTLTSSMESAYEMLEGGTPTGPIDPKTAREEYEAVPDTNYDSFPNKGYITTPESVAETDIILDVGPGYFDSDTHIKGAIYIDWESFLDESQNYKLKSVPQLASILGDAGIRESDSVVVYGDCPDCGGKSVATFAFWVMRYLGHDDVSVLDGGIDAWKAAGKPVETTTNARDPVVYTPAVRPALLADYESVSGGGVQIVDARPFKDFAGGSLKGAILISYDEVLKDDGSIRDSETLSDLFAALDGKKSIAVYDEVGVKASMIWYALQLMGYSDVSIYTLQDWTAHQPKLNIDLKEIRADPSPSPPGPVKITAVLIITESEDVEDVAVAGEGPTDGGATDGDSTETEPALVIEKDDDSSAGSATGEDVTTSEPATGTDDIPAGDGEDEDIDPDPTDAELTVMGCASCGADYYIHSTSTDSSTGGVQLSPTYGNPADSVVAATTGVQLSSSYKEDSTSITCAAIISNSGGYETKVNLLESGDEYVGTWYANVSPGTYSVTIEAYASGLTRTFEDALTIEITGDEIAGEETAGGSSSTDDYYKKLSSY